MTTVATRGLRLSSFAAALALLGGLIAPAPASTESNADSATVWEGGWAAEHGDFDAKSSTGGWYQVQRNSTRVNQLWKNGYWGQGIGVAVIDTGSLPVVGLNRPGAIVNGLDISIDSQNPDVLHLDGYGHGVHMAGIIAGSSGDTTPKSPSFQSFTGMAPSSHVVSVKVGSSDGAVDVSQVIAAVDWVVEHKDDPGLNIRVLNMSFGFDSIQGAQLDPLSHAVENAWRAGIVVVAAAGNDGNGAQLRMPARNPYVIAVGSYEQSYGLGGEPVSTFSNCGDTWRSVDLVAPGRSIVGPRAPGSYLDETYPNARAGSDYFKGSGTSQSTAIVSGGIAALLSAKPSLTPDAVKNLLMDTAAPVIGSTLCSGAGAVNFAEPLLAQADTTPQTWPVSTGEGSLDDARGSQRLTLDGVSLTGEQDIFGHEWDAVAWAVDSSNGSTWNGGLWNGEAWSGLSWSGLSWSGLSWSGLSWSGLSWSGLSWSGLSWSGRSWSGESWSGLSWSSGTWQGLSWSGLSWSSLS